MDAMNIYVAVGPRLTFPLCFVFPDSGMLLRISKSSVFIRMLLSGYSFVAFVYLFVSDKFASEMSLLWDGTEATGQVWNF